MAGAPARLRLAARAWRSAPQPAIRESYAGAGAQRTDVRVVATTAVAIAAATAAGTVVYADVAMQPAAPRTETDFPFLQPLSMTATDESSGWGKLAHGDLGAALASADRLRALAADADNHRSLISTGALFALCEALERALADESGASAPLAARAVAALADIARTTPAAKDFNRAAPLLVRTLAKYPAVEATSWTEWIGKQVGLGTTSADTGVALDLRPGIAHDTMRCLANLARDSAAHASLLTCEALDVAATTLRRVSVKKFELAMQQHDTVMVDTVRSAALAVAALAKSAGARVVKLGTHKSLVEYASCGVDSVAQTYAAAGLRNLARHPPEDTPDGWRVHREVVVAGAPKALASTLAPNADSQAQMFAILTIGDLVTSGHHRAHLIRRYLAPVYKPMMELAVGGNDAVARAACRVVSVAYENELQNDEMSAALIDVVGQLVQGPVARGDVAAMRALARVAVDKQVADALVAGGAVETLRTAVQRGRGPYFEEATRAMAKLVEHENIRAVVADKGALQAALKRPCMEHDGMWTATLCANAARDEELRPIVAHGALAVLVRTAGVRDVRARREAMRALHNLAIGGPARVMVAQADAAATLVSAAKCDDAVTRRAAVGALAGIAESYEYAPALVAAGTIDTVISAARESDDEDVIRDAARTLAQLTGNEAVHPALAEHAVPWLGEMLKKSGPAHYYAAIALCNLTYSEGVGRAALKTHGVTSTLNVLAASHFGHAETQAAKQALSNLAGETPAMVPIEPRPFDAL